MATEIKERTTESVENVVMGADLVTGAAVTVAENLARTANHPVREARKIERRGAVANRKISRDVAGLVEDTAEAIEAVMPERVALLGLGAMKARARRKDFVGDVAYRALEIVNGGLEAVAGTFNRLERASKPPVRPGSTHTRPARPVRKAAGRVVRKTAGAARTARTTARTGAARARRTERRGA